MTFKIPTSTFGPSNFQSGICFSPRFGRRIQTETLLKELKSSVSSEEKKEVLKISVLNPQFFESPGEPIKRAYIQAKNSFRSIYFETLRRAKKTGC